MTTVPQVALPLATGKTAESTGYFASGNTVLKGKVYLFPGFEDYQFILVKPCGNKAKGTKRDWQVLEVSTGYKIADTIRNGTAQQAINMAWEYLKVCPKSAFEQQLQKMRDAIAAYLAKEEAKRTPQALAAEIQKHEDYLAMVDAGLAKISQSDRTKRETYIASLRSELMQKTSEGLESLQTLTDEELLAELAE